MQTGVRNFTMNRTLSLIVVFICFITFGCTSTRAVKSADKTLTQQTPSPVQSEIENDNKTTDTEAADEQPAEIIKEAPQDAPLTSRELPLKNLLGEIFTDNKTDSGPTSQKISLNFDNADIYEVINSLSDLFLTPPQFSHYRTAQIFQCIVVLVWAFIPEFGTDACEIVPFFSVVHRINHYIPFIAGSSSVKQCIPQL